MYRDITVGVVVPAYNESGSVGAVIDTLPEFVDRAYVVDDGSTDDTWAEIRRHAAARNGDHDGRFEDLVVPIRHERNRGVGGAIKTGYLRAREEGIDATAVLGGDGQMDPEQLPRYLDPIADGAADYVKGNRFTSPGDWSDIPRFRMVGNVILSYLTKVASGYWGTMDSQNGYTAISLDALQAVDVEGMYEYYGYCNDLLVRCNVAGIRVADVPRASAYAYDDWHSHIAYREYVPRVSAMLARGFLRRLSRKYLLTDYHPVAPLYLLGAGATGAGLLGLVASLLDRDRDGPGTWLLAVLAGAATFLYATLLDRAENRPLEVGVFESGDDAGRSPDGHEARDPEGTPTGNGESPAGDGEPPAPDGKPTTAAGESSTTAGESSTTDGETQSTDPGEDPGPVGGEGTGDDGTAPERTDDDGTIQTED